jgi:hypothetical protein
MILPYFTRFYNTKLAQNNALYQLSGLSKPGAGFCPFFRLAETRRRQAMPGHSIERVKTEML